jgi:hypothetical protein
VRTRRQVVRDFPSEHKILMPTAGACDRSRTGPDPKSGGARRRRHLSDFFSFGPCRT